MQGGSPLQGHHPRGSRSLSVESDKAVSVLSSHLGGGGEVPLCFPDCWIHLGCLRLHWGRLWWLWGATWDFISTNLPLPPLTNRELFVCCRCPAFSLVYLQSCPGQSAREVTRPPFGGVSGRPQDTLSVNYGNELVAEWVSDLAHPCHEVQIYKQ
jgi:hypothetical protein